MSAFDEHTAALDGAVVDAFADRATVTPRTIDQYAGAAADPDRSAFDVCGVLSKTSEVNRAMPERYGPDVETASVAAEFWIPKANIPADPPRKGDALSFPGTAEPTYSVALANPTDRGDLNLILTVED